MSRENVVQFFTALTQSNDLKLAALKAPPQPEAWVELAKKNGFEFSTDELHGVVQASLKKSDLDKNATVEAFLAATRSGGELKDEQLEGVAGGSRSFGVESQDKLGNFEIQSLMSDYNESQTLMSSVLKKKDDAGNAVIQKIG